ncbi:hypothetical protein IFU39_16705 [Paenibacillus sp. CFBP 13594]|uniref:hypothetical protein n=1 Tax=Paenibacillus sp. CFBP 13594 TaxID=2774037 RepID=UPI00177E83CB|nr:hypothetical protein [Paenibacillus sp. CFBP 13594]MBD8839455.1 hypothetical protein [Paenibacillus sp. CFBP 13594]
MSKWIELSENVAVEVHEREGNLFDACVVTKWYKSDPWSIEEDYVKAANGLSSMQVYGYIEYEVKPAYIY